ncbi:MAG TPA: tRNA-binding protein [Thermoanaerobaculia bacterium]|nr:tRNA-binding protein [Thermoanaerobaculia bacterium]
MITYPDFDKVEIRAGRIVRAERFPEARKPAYKLWIDFGDELGVKRSSAQVTGLYTPEDLAGRLVVAVTNFPPKQIASFLSEVLVLGIQSSEGVVLLAPDREVPLGGRVL